jgi:hypothetical protein
VQKIVNVINQNASSPEESARIAVMSVLAEVHISAVQQFVVNKQHLYFRLFAGLVAMQSSWKV